MYRYMTGLQKSSKKRRVTGAAEIQQFEVVGRNRIAMR
jgi:hypothetical protein